VGALDTPFNREAAGPEAFYFVDCGDALERVITDIAELPEAEDARLRDGNVHRAAEHFSLAAVADAYEDLLVAAADASRFTKVTVPTRWSDG
jgi:hypothetical protein